MKVKIIPSIISVLIAVLSGYAVYSFAAGDKNLLLGISSAVIFAITLFGVFGFALEEERSAANIHVVSGIFNVLFLIIAIVFACLHVFSGPLYLIINGILLLVWMAIIHWIANTNLRRQ